MRSISARVFETAFLSPTTGTRATIIPARTIMMAMTTRISMSVKPPEENLGFRISDFKFRICTSLSIRPVLVCPQLGAHFFFHPLAEPLLDHALVVQIPGASEPLDTRKHARVNAQADVNRLGLLGAGDHGRFHEP